MHLVSNWGTKDRLFVDADKVIDDNIWHYIVATYDGSKSATGINIYLELMPNLNL